MDEEATENEREARQFLEVLGRGLGAEERLILCGVKGDPNTAEKRAWRPRPWRPGRDVPIDVERENGYVTVGAFGKAPDGSYRRRGDTFRSGLALMVDDVGTKVPRSVVESVPPTAIVETSPGNAQWWYRLREPCRDRETFDALIRAFIARRLLGADPGMSGVTRVGRVPGCLNGKAKYGGAFRVRTLWLDERAEYSMEALVLGFGLELKGRTRPRDPIVTDEAVAARRAAFVAVWEALKEAGALKRAEPDPSGWIEIRCPWVDEHTDRADSGAAIREPAPENEWYGAFRCFHGHCADRGWAELTEAVAADAWTSLEHANEQDAAA